MKEISKIYTAITIVQISFTLAALSIASLGVVIKHPFLVYFWYMTLGGILAILTTSLVMAVALVITRIFQQHPSSGGSAGKNGWFSRPKSAQA
jgi:uncharacterized membrane protein